MSSASTAPKKTKKKGPIATETPDPETIIPIESLYSIQEVKTETNPMIATWLDMVLQEQELVRPSSSLDPERLLELWNLQSSRVRFDDVLSDLMNQHPEFSSDTQTSPLTFSTSTIYVYIGLFV